MIRILLFHLFAAFATVPARTINAMRFGITIRPLKRSDRFHTRSTFSREPRKTDTTDDQRENGTTAFFPNRYCTFCLAKSTIRRWSRMQRTEDRSLRTPVEAFEAGSECRLCDRGSFNTGTHHLFQNAGRKNNESGHGQDNEGINKDTDHRYFTLILRVLDIGNRMGMRVEPIPASLEKRPRATP